MRISIVTTTLNAMPYIVDTTRSVLQSNHRDLEYVLIDAGSSDGTLEHIKQIRDSRASVEIIPGISAYEAVDRGFRNSTGDIVAWINGDDLYYPWTISCVSKVFAAFPEVQWITGLATFLNVDGHCTVRGGMASYPRRYIQNGWFNELGFGYLQQENMFWRRSLYEEAGGLNLKYVQAADFDLWIRMARHAELVAVNVPLGAFRRRGTNRSVTGRSKYLQDVEDATRALPKMGGVKSYLCRTSMVAKHALRLSEWHRTSWICCSEPEPQWKLKSAIRPISRYSVQQLMTEAVANRVFSDRGRT
jgi:glycosyltransferase involved in cell wall biosynthesis